MRLLNTILTLTIGVIRDSRLRRTCMFYCVLAALILLFSGSTFLRHPLRGNAWVFIGYWFVCAWLTITAVLLALYDMIAIRAAARRERRRLEKEILQRARESLVDDENKA